MANFDDLYLKPGETLKAEDWNTLVDKIKDLKIPPAGNDDIINNTNIGIGTTTPKKKLHISHNGPIDLLMKNTKRDNGLQLHVNHNTYISNRNEFSGAGTTGKKNGSLILNTDESIILQTGKHKTNPKAYQGEPRLVILKDGNIGVGTDKPVNHLHVKGELRIEDGWIRVTGNNGLYFQTHGGGFHMQDKIWIRTYKDKSIYAGKGTIKTAGELKVGDTGEKFIVNSTGKVGVGTNLPKTALHLKSNNALITLEGTTGSYLRFYPETISKGRKAWLGFTSSGTKPNPSFYIRNENPNGFLALGTNKKDRLVINPKGRTTINGNWPIKLVRYSKLGDNITHNTKYPVKDWNASIAGFTASGGDIQENSAGTIMRMRMIAKGSTWHIRADFKTHRSGENWYVDVMFIRREISDCNYNPVANPFN